MHAFFNSRVFSEIRKWLADSVCTPLQHSPIPPIKWIHTPIAQSNIISITTFSLQTHTSYFSPTFGNVLFGSLCIIVYECVVGYMTRHMEIRNSSYLNLRRIRDAKSQQDGKSYSFSDVVDWLHLVFMRNGGYERTEIPAKSRRKRGYTRRKKIDVPIAYVDF